MGHAIAMPCITFDNWHATLWWPLQRDLMEFYSHCNCISGQAQAGTWGASWGLLGQWGLTLLPMFLMTEQGITWARSRLLYILGLGAEQGITNTMRNNYKYSTGGKYKYNSEEAAGVPHWCRFFQLYLCLLLVRCSPFESFWNQRQSHSSPCSCHLWPGQLTF